MCENVQAEFYKKKGDEKEEEEEEEIPDEASTVLAQFEEQKRNTKSQETTGSSKKRSSFSIYKAFQPEADEHRELPTTPGSAGGSKRTLEASVHMTKAFANLQKGARRMSKGAGLSQFITPCSTESQDEEKSSAVSSRKGNAMDFLKPYARKSDVTVLQKLSFFAKVNEGDKTAETSETPKSVKQLRKNLLDVSWSAAQ